jgi:hypothetical protein
MEGTQVSLSLLLGARPDPGRASVRPGLGRGPMGKRSELVDRSWVVKCSGISGSADSSPRDLGLSLLLFESVPSSVR